MQYKFRGSLELRIPEGVELFGEGDSKEEALHNMLSLLLSDEDGMEKYINTDYLKVSAVKKVFKVRVREVFTHEVEVSTEDYPEITDESDAEYYVENHLEDFDGDFDYDEWSRDEIETDCRWCDTEEEEIEL